jgi:hypothetical protein
VRIVQAAGRPLSDVRADFGKSPTLSNDVDVVVCAGAQDDGDASPNIVREDLPATIMRGGSKNLEFHTSVTPLFGLEA